MEIYIKNASETDPTISLNHKKNVLSFSGKSFPEDASALYDPITQWIASYGTYLLSKKEDGIDTESVVIVCHFKFDMLSSSSQLKIRDVIQEVIEIAGMVGCSFEIHWHHFEEDEDMLEAGEEYEDLFGIKFQYHPLS